MIVLHHLDRSRSQRIAWLLEELGVGYELRTYLRDAQTRLAPPELKAVHPLGKSPMVEVDGRLIAESGAIVEALCARFGPHLVPEAGSDGHIAYLEWIHFAEGSAMTPILLQLYTGQLGDASAPLRPRIMDQLAAHFGFMDRAVSKSGHFVGDQLTGADIMLSFPAEVAVRGKGRGLYPGLARFVDTMRKRPAYERALAKTAQAEAAAKQN
ncbi:MAG: glutathione S-transferase [Pseudomonadota bacterium]